MNQVKRKKIILKTLGLLIALFSIFGGAVYLYGTTLRVEESPVVSTVENRIEKYGYYINDNANDYYKSEFEILKGMAEQEVSEEDLAKQIAKLYTIDLNSLKDKINKYEVTSSQYYYSEKEDMHTQKVLENYYNKIEDNSTGTRSQILPEVSLVEIASLEETTYKLDEDKVKAYQIKVNITYKEKSSYDTKATIVLVRDNNTCSVVQYESAKSWLFSWKKEAKPLYIDHSKEESSVASVVLPWLT